MSEPNITFHGAIDNARALLDTLLASDWSDIHVVSGESEIFIARDGGRSNPMRQAPLAAQPVSAPVESADERGLLVTAPHVATIVDIVSIGTVLQSGDRIATIRVLESEEEVPAPQSGTVTEIHAERGRLIEFKAPIASLGVAGR